MKYLEVTLYISPFDEAYADIAAAMLGEIDYESFLTTDNGIQAYIPATLYDENKLHAAISKFPVPHVRLTYSTKEMPDNDWNREWEENSFQPINIDGRCLIHSTLHNISLPGVEYDIIINPQMAFGTGTHQTTELIIRKLLDTDLTGKSVLDMGCGTGILGILAHMRGAKEITSIDIDEWSVENTKENFQLNHICPTRVVKGDANTLNEFSFFDIILANINRNILLNDMHAYAAHLHKNGQLLMSGFYKNDIPLILEEASRNGLAFVSSHEKEEWVATLFQKP